MWRELVIYLLCYLAISLIYRFFQCEVREVPDLSNSRFVLIGGENEEGEPIITKEQKYFEKVPNVKKASLFLTLMNRSFIGSRIVAKCHLLSFSVSTCLLW